MNKQRLRKIIKSIKTIKPSEFDMGHWMSLGPHCKTTGCAIGHFCIQHPKEPLQLKISGTIDNISAIPTIIRKYTDKEMYWDDWHRCNKYKTVEKTKELVEFDAIACYLDIPTDHTVELFGQNKTKQGVIKSLEDYLKGSWKKVEIDKIREPCYE